MKVTFLGIAGVFAVVFSLALSSIAFAKGCPYSGGKKSESGQETTQEEDLEASDAE